MPLPLADVSDWLTAAPLAFLVGLVVGLGLCSRGYRITREPDRTHQPPGGVPMSVQDQPEQPQPPPDETEEQRQQREQREQREERERQQRESDKPQEGEGE